MCPGHTTHTHQTTRHYRHLVSLPAAGRDSYPTYGSVCARALSDTTHVTGYARFADNLIIVRVVKNRTRTGCAPLHDDIFIHYITAISRNRKQRAHTHTHMARNYRIDLLRLPARWLIHARRCWCCKRNVDRCPSFGLLLVAVVVVVVVVVCARPIKC